MSASKVPERKVLERLFSALLLIRRTEETIAEIYPTDKIKSPVHLSIGQEAVSVGVCDVLRDDDVMSATYRGHAAYLARGGDLNGMMAELFGKSTGVAGGKAGSMHLVDIKRNILGMSAVVGTTIPVAMGYALALKREGKGRCVVCFFGDGATEEGVFTESLNFASLHALPILFVCENNFYAIHSPLSHRWATDKLCERVETYGIPAHRIEDGDLFAIRETAGSVMESIRGGEGPAFMECLTYRWKEHVGPDEDYDAGYRPKDEQTEWLERDPVSKLSKMIEPGKRDAITVEVEKKITAAVAFAEQSSWPDQEELLTHVYAE